MADFSKIGKSNVRRSKAHERRIAKLLEEYTGVEFRRRRVEGRDATTIERESTSDVISVRGTPKFSIEAKSGKKFSLDGLLASPKTNIFTEWWHQANYDAQLLTNHFKGTTKQQFYPLVFFKFNVNSDWIAIPIDVVSLQVIQKKKTSVNPLGIGEIELPYISYNGYSMANPIGLNVVRTKNKNNYRIVSLDLPNVAFCRWKHFVEAIEPSSFFY